MLNETNEFVPAAQFKRGGCFQIPSLWAAARTAPYFHDNSAKTLEDVARHYALFVGAISPSQDIKRRVPPALQGETYSITMTLHER